MAFSLTAWVPRLAVVPLLCHAALASISPEAGQYSIRNYAPKDYGASPQNWAVAEDSRGVMYFGNTDGLLEFDGVHWRRVEYPGNGTVRSLAVGPDGAVYVGGQNEAGYLSTGASGRTRYVSLLDRLDPKERRFGEVWSIVATPDGIYFSTTERLILWNRQAGVRTWTSGGRFRRAFWIEGTLYAQVTGKGLLRLDRETLVPAAGGEKLEKVDVRGVFNSSRGPVLATGKGFFLKTATGFEELSTEASRAAGEALLYRLAQLPNNVVALGTARAGLILADSEGRVLRTIRKESGLPSDYIAAIAADRQGGVWLATGNGIARFVPRFTEYSEANGLRGSLYTLGRWRGSLYAGTTSGLFRLDGSAQGGVFVPMPGVMETVWVMLSGPDGLYIGTQRGLYVLREDRPELIWPSEVVYDLAFPRGSKDRLLLAGRGGATILRRQGSKWEKAAEIPSKGEEYRTIAEGEDGSLWATTRTAILRADANTDRPTVKTYRAAEGVPTGWTNLFRIGASLYFATENGLIRPTGDGQRFAADERLGRPWADGSRGILLMRPDARENIWISGRNYHGVLTRPANKEAEWQPMPLAGAGLDELWVLHGDTDGVVWASGSEGRLVRYDPAFASPIREPLRVLLTGLLDARTRQSLGAGAGEGEGRAPLRLPYSLNSLRAEFSAPFYDVQGRVEYQVSTQDTFSDSDPWSNEPWKDLSNLWEGRYELKVRARSPYGDRSEAATLAFRIDPPWYRAWYAYLLYGLSGGTLVWAIIRWRLSALKASNLELERLVDERTAEIRRQRDQIFEQEQKTEALLLNILPATVAEELRANGSVEPMYFDDVTVCFTDFVGFTVSSEKIEAGALVARLHEYFTAFDHIVARYGLEKLKTIGDSYMFVAGLPEADSEHASKAVLAALEIVAAAQAIGARQTGLSWSLRVGLHSGPVVAGVVGQKKFAFDVWGDTVNLASRMESSGSPNRVNLSRQTYDLVRHAVRCEARGPVRTKDGRDLEMFFAVEPLAAPEQVESRSATKA